MKRSAPRRVVAPLVCMLLAFVPQVAAQRHRARSAPAIQHPAASRPTAVIVALRESAELGRQRYASRRGAHEAILQRLSAAHGFGAWHPAVSTLHRALDAAPAAASTSSAFGQSLAQQFPVRAARGIAAPERVDPLTFYVLEFGTESDMTGVCRELARDADVRFAEPDYLLALSGGASDPLFAKQWALHNTGQPYPIPVEGGGEASGTPDSDIDVVEAWAVAGERRPVIVAVIDTGVDTKHEDIVESLWFDRDGHFGRDLWNGDDDPQDDHGHGTHVAGTIAATPGNGLGVAGVCPDARIMAIKAFSSTGVTVTSVVLDAMLYGVAQGADILSNSWGGGELSQAMQAIVNYSRAQGVLVVAAAGNSNTASPFYPAALDHVVGVAATNARDQRAGFSNFGDMIDLTAPGVDVLSLRAAGTDMYRQQGEPLTHIFEEQYYIASGTSMACPHVSGAAAMLWSLFPKLTPDEIAARLRGTADDIAALNPGFESALGSGRLNLHQALAALRQPRIRLRGVTLTELAGDGNDIAERGETVALDIVIRNEWSDAEAVDVELSTSHAEVQILSPQVFAGDMADGAALGLTFDLMLEIDAPRRLSFELRAVPANGALQTLDFEVDLLLPLLDGWPRRLDVPADARLQATVADLDGDGSDDIALTDGFAFATVLRADGEVLDGFWPRVVDAEVALAVGNLDGGTELEVVAGADTAVSAWRADASDLPGWPNPFGGSVVVADLDGLSGDEVLLSSGVRLFAFRGNGQTHPAAWPMAFDGDVGRPAVADLDLDGTLEIIIAADEGSLFGNRVYAFRQDGAPLSGAWPLSFTSAVAVDGIAIGDVTGGGFPEIVVATINGRVYLFDARGELISGHWPARLPPNTPVTDAAVADLDGDGRGEIVITARTPQAFALDQNAQLLPGWPAAIDSPASILTQLPNRILGIADFNQDGSAELLIGGGFGPNLISADGRPFDGAALFGVPADDRSTIHDGALSLGDINGDGNTELVVAAGDQVFVYTLPGSAAQDIQWAGHRGSSGRTGSAAPGAITDGQIVRFSAETYGLNQPVVLALESDGANQDANGIDAVVLEVSSQREPQPELLTLHETAVDSGIFTASVVLQLGEPQRDGVVQVSVQDLLVGRYFDTQTREWHADQATIDGAGPVILHADPLIAVGFEDGEFYAELAWTTNEPARGRVKYGQLDPTTASSWSDVTTTPRVRIEDLEPGATYRFLLESQDVLGNVTVDDNDGAFYITEIDQTAVTRVQLRLGGEPLSGAFIRIDARDTSGTVVGSWSYQQLPDSGQRLIDLAAGQTVDLDVGVVLQIAGNIGTFQIAEVSTPGDVILDLDTLQLELLDNDRPLVETDVRTFMNCIQGRKRTTDSDGRVQMYAQRDSTFGLEISAARLVRTAVHFEVPGSAVVDVATLPENMRVQVVDQGQPVSGAAVRFFQDTDSGLELRDGPWLTDDQGMVIAWSCPGPDHVVQAGSYPEAVRSQPVQAPSFNDPPLDVLLELDQLRIVGSTPEAGAVDARQTTMPDGSAAGWDTVIVAFDGTRGAQLPAPSEFELRVRGGTGAPPTVVAVQPLDGTQVQLTFDRPIEPGAWTSVIHVPSRTATRLGYLPGDVDGNTQTHPIDILKLIDHLNGVVALPDHATDIDRDGEVSPADILRLIDLQSGVDSDDWRGRRLKPMRGLYWIDDFSGAARGADLDGSGLRDVLDLDDGASELLALVPDTSTEKLYWAIRNAANETVRFGHCDRDGTNARTLHTRQDVELISFAVDPVGGAFFWSDANGNRIRRAAIGSDTVEDVILTIEAMVPGVIALELRERMIYWSASGALFKAGLDLPDGQTAENRSDIELLIAGGVDEPVALTVDGNFNLMYWLELDAPRMMRAFTSGAGVTELVDFGMLDPSGLAVDDQGYWIYWSDRELGVIQRVDVGGFSVEFLITQGLRRPRNILFAP